MKNEKYCKIQKKTPTWAFTFNRSITAQKMKKSLKECSDETLSIF